MGRQLDRTFQTVMVMMMLVAVASPVFGQTNTITPPAAPVAPAAHVRKIRALDCDNHSILINHPGFVSVVLGTSEDSQDAARAAGKVMYPLQGRPDFQLVVVVDLRNSMATWAPSVVYSQMRSNLDDQALELKPYFLQNGNKGNPRLTSYVIPDFSGTVCPLLGWNDSSDSLRGILYGVDGKEITRWDKISDMGKLQTDVRAAIQALIDADKEHAAATAKTQGNRASQLPSLHPAMLPPAPIPAADD